MYFKQLMRRNGGNRLQQLINHYIIQISGAFLDQNKKILWMFSYRCFLHIRSMNCNKLPAMKCFNFLPGSCSTWCCMLSSEMFSSKQISGTGFGAETMFSTW